MSAARTKALCLFVSVSLLLFCSATYAQQQDFEREAYHRALDYCRGDVARPMAIGADQGILCFDGLIDKDMDVSLVAKLREGGLFVVRSSGGDIVSAISLSDLLRDRRAVVVRFCRRKLDFIEREPLIRILNRLRTIFM